jgi:hypothetical protein
VLASALAYAAAALVAAWGVLHVIPTFRVVEGFEPITPSNRYVILQEWIAEGMTMWGIAALVFAVTAAGAGSDATIAYGVSAALLIALSILTALTGARTGVVWFKVCPFLQGAAAALLVSAAIV